MKFCSTTFEQCLNRNSGVDPDENGSYANRAWLGKRAWSKLLFERRLDFISLIAFFTQKSCFFTWQQKCSQMPNKWGGVLINKGVRKIPKFDRLGGGLNKRMSDFEKCF